MKSFTIHELEVLTDVKAHTIRIWERRYAALCPERTAGNVRRYSIDEFRKVLQWSLLSRAGYRISKVSAMGEPELQSALRGLPGEEAQLQRVINDLLLCMYRYDIHGFERTLDSSFRQWSPARGMRDILYPFLQRVGLLTLANRLHEEHLIVTAARRKMYWCIEELQEGGDKTVLLFLPSGRQLDLLLLYLHYQLKRRGWQVLCLGADVSLQHLEGMLQCTHPRYLITYFPKKSTIPLLDLSSMMQRISPSTRMLMVGGEEQTPYGNISPVSVEDVLKLYPARMEEGVLAG